MGDYDEPSGPRLHGIPNLDWPGDYDEEIGTRQSFPEINTKIREQLGLPKIAPETSGLETKVKPTVFLLAARQLELTETGEKISKKERLRILRDLKNLGIPISRQYYKLKAPQLRGFFMDVKRKVYAQAREYGYEPGEETAAYA
ncbi:MAG: hypothetical protein ABSG05_02860 [Candidatus Pacearchaeota archaeon]|jgi:hypothetical protein